MRFILFFKIFNISWKFQKWKESSEKRFCFSDNSSCICCVKLRREYLSWAVKFFKKCPKTSFIWKRFSNSISEPWKRWKKYCAADFSCVWYTLACWLLKGVLKRGFETYLSNHVFDSLKFLKYISDESHRFFICSKFDTACRNSAKDWENVFFLR